MPMLSISTICCSSEFKLLKKEWDDLLNESDSCSIFLTWEWLYTWWDLFGENYNLNIITLRTKSNRLVGIAPFCITSIWGELPKKTICFLGATGVSSEYLDIISSPLFRNEVAVSTFDALCSSTSKWECIVISDILVTSLGYTIFKDIAVSKGFSVNDYPSETCPYLHLNEDSKITLSQLNGKMRSTIKRAGKKLDKLNVRFTISNNQHDLDGHLQILFELHQACWNERGEQGSFKDDIKKAFHLDIARLLMQKDFLRLYTLSVNDETISAIYAFQFKSKLFYFQSGYSPKWKQYSPGSVLMWKCIEDATSRKLIEFDYLRGTESYKSLWANKSKETRCILLLPPKKKLIKIFFLLRDTKRTIINRTKKIVKQLILS